MEFEKPQLNLEFNKEPKNECKGHIYKCKVNQFINKRGEYVSQERMIPLKRKSCPGCEFCGPTLDDLKESIANDTMPIIDDRFPKNNSLYKLVICNITTDWETGYVDGWDLYFEKIEDE